MQIGLICSRKQLYRLIIKNKSDDNYIYLIHCRGCTSLKDVTPKKVFYFEEGGVS